MSTVLTAAVVSAMLATGAGGEIVVWHGYRSDEARAVRDIAEAFGEAEGLEVRVLQVPFGAYLNKLRQAINSGVGPDLFVGIHDQIGDFRARGMIDAPPDIRSGRFLPRTVEAVTVDGEAWGWPLAFKSLVLFYRTDLVAKPPIDTDAIEELRTTADFPLAYEAGNFYYHAPWFFAHGATLFAQGAPRLASPEAAAAGDTMRRWLQTELIPSDVNGALVTELFNRGRTAMVINGPWFANEIAPDVPYAVAPLPVLSQTGQPARPLLSVELLLVGKGKGRPEVLRLAEAIAGPAGALIRARLGRQPVAVTQTYADLPNDRFLQTFHRQLEHTVLTPTVEAMPLLWEPLNEALRQIGRGATSSSAAMSTAQRRVTVLMRPLPQERPAAPYILGLIAAVLVGAGWLWRRHPFRLRDLRDNLHAYGFLAPTAVGMGVLVGVPFVAGVGVAFYAYGRGENHFVGVSNFVEILTASGYGVTDPMSFYYTLVVTTAWAVINVSLHVILGLALALALNQSWVVGRGLWRVILILPWAIPSYITALVFKGLFNRQLGAINALLQRFGVEPVGWFDSFWPAFVANITTNVWLGFPFMMITILGILQSIPPDLHEAARLDGANAVQRLLRITLPLVAPALMPAIVLGTIWTFNMFNVVFLVSEGQPEGATDILVTEAYRWAFAREGRYGYAAAYSVVIFAILLLYGRVTRRLTRGSLA